MTSEGVGRSAENEVQIIRVKGWGSNNPKIMRTSFMYGRSNTMYHFRLSNRRLRPRASGRLLPQRGLHPPGQPHHEPHRPPQEEPPLRQGEERQAEAEPPPEHPFQRLHPRLQPSFKLHGRPGQRSILLFWVPRRAGWPAVPVSSRQPGAWG